MTTKIPYAKAVHGQEEIDAVVRVLNSSTQMGQHVADFEQKIADLFGHDHGVMVNSGSSANYLAVEICDFPKGAEVITPILTFSTTVAPIVKNGLIPNFVDVTPGTYLIDHDQIEAKINERTVALMIPNLIGNIADWPRLRRIADKHKLILIEDSADTLGATIKGKKDGSYADIITTSFYGSHIINCAGNGGMLCVKDKNLAERARVLRSWGRYSSIFDDAENLDNRFNADSGVEYDNKFLFSAIGYNLEPSEISAAYGLEQLNRLAEFKALRQKYFARHQAFFSQFENWLTLPKPNVDADFAWLSYPLTLKPTAPFKRNDLQKHFEHQGIQTRPIFTGNILRQPGFSQIDCVAEPSYPIADTVMLGGILLGLHQGLTDLMVDTVHETFATFAKQFEPEEAVDFA